MTDRNTVILFSYISHQGDYWKMFSIIIFSTCIGVINKPYIQYMYVLIQFPPIFQAHGNVLCIQLGSHISTVLTNHLQVHMQRATGVIGHQLFHTEGSLY